MACGGGAGWQAVEITDYAVYVAEYLDGCVGAICVRDDEYVLCQDCGICNGGYCVAWYLLGGCVLGAVCYYYGGVCIYM